MTTGTILKDAVLLWTNSNPTGTFAAQPITLDLSKYSHIYIIFRYGASTAQRYTKIVPVDGKRETIYNTGGLDKATGYIGTRIFTPSSTGVDFGNAYQRSLHSTSAASSNNNVLIPQQIYGLRG